MSQIHASYFLTGRTESDWRRVGYQDDPVVALGDIRNRIGCLGLGKIPWGNRLTRDKHEECGTHALALFCDVNNLSLRAVGERRPQIAC
jgi:hypothetical protein